MDRAGQESQQTEPVSVVAADLAAPAAVRATAERDNRIGITWTPVAGSTARYNVYRSTDQSNWALLTPSPISGWFYKDSDLTEGTTCYYQVEAVEGAVASPRSGIAGAVAVPARRLGVDDRWTMVPIPALSGNMGYLNLQSGNLVLQGTDAALPGPVFANVLRRTYNSQGDPNSALGPGWRLNAEWRLVNRGTSIIVIEGDGTEHRFKPGATAGAWVSDEPRYFWEIAEPGDGTYVLRTPDQTEFRFDAAGRLAEIRDRTGNALMYGYDAATGRLGQVTNGANRSFAFTYGSGGQLARVDYPTGRSVHYGYDAAGRLSSVTDAAGQVTTYTYDGAGQLIRVTDPSGRWLAFSYDGLDRLIAVTDGSRNRTRVAYSGGITTVTDPNGYQTEFVFNAQGWLTRLTDAVQTQQAEPKSWTYAYDLNASPWTMTVTNPGGLVSTASFDERGNLVQEAVAGTDLVAPGVNSLTTYYYYGGNNGGPNDLHRVVDPEGNATEYFYTGTGPARIERVVDAEGGTTTFSYHTANLAMVQTVTDAEGNVATYSYTPEWDLRSAVHTVYNPVTATTAYLEQSYEYVDGMPVTVSGLHQQGTTEFPVVRTTYDELGHITRVDYPDGSQESVILNTYGNVGLAVDRGGVHATYRYDAASRVVAEVAEDGGTTRYTYSGPAVTRIEDPDSLVTEFSYDGLYRVLATRRPDQTVIRTEYDAVGNAVAVVQGPSELFTNPQSAKGYRVTASYYGANLVREVREPLPASGLLAASGAPIAYQGCAGSGTDCNVQTYTYNKVGKPLTLTDGNGYITTYEYDRVYRLRFVTDALGNPAEYVYDRLGRTTEVYKVGYPRWKLGSDGQYYQTRPHKYVYDGLGRVVQSSTPVIGSYRDTFYTYNAAGDLVQEQRPNGVTIAYEYNAGHQLARKSYTNATQTPEVRFAVDAAGRRLLKADVYGNTWYQYDNMGRQIQVRGMLDRVDYSYTANGRRHFMDFSAGTVEYAYDAYGRLSQMTDPVGNTATFQYDEYGHTTQVNMPVAGLTNTFYRLPNLPSGDPGPMTDRLQKREWKNSAGTAVWWSGTYRYDHPGNVREAKVTWHSSIANSTNKLPASQTITYTYDKVYRLTQYHDTDTYKPPYNDYYYVYDAAGNRLRAGNKYDSNGNLVWHTANNTDVSLERRFDFLDPHEWYAWNAFTPDYEQVGPQGDFPNVTYTSTGALRSEEYYRTNNTTGPWDYYQNYLYDDADRLTQSQSEHALGGCYEGMRWFAYDGDGRLAAADSLSFAECFLFSRTVYEYDGATVISENGRHGDGNVWYITVPGGGTLYSLRVRGQDLKADAHITDHLGSTVEVVDYAGKIANWYVYDAFGIINGSSSELINSYTFTSSVRDHVTGLYFMGARVYNASIGRFLTQDTYKGSIWEPWTQNLYAYVGNDPVNMVDPTGHRSQRIVVHDDHITILWKVAFSGAGATEANVQTAIAGIESYWSGQYDGFTVTVTVEYVIVDDFGDLNDTTYDRLTIHGDDERGVSRVNPTFWERIGMGVLADGTRRWQGDIYLTRPDGSSNNIGWVAAHEFAHFLGLNDRYTTTYQNDGTRTTAPILGWEGNMMGDYGGAVDNRNIRGVLSINHWFFPTNAGRVYDWVHPRP